MKKSIYKFLTLSFMALALGSCLKDDTMVTDPDKAVGNVVEIGNTGSPTSAAGAPVFAFTPATLDPAKSPTTKFTTSVRYAGAEDVAPQDITVTLAAAPEAVTAWNTAYPTAQFQYNQLPTNAFSFPTSVTIKKGEKAAYFDITVKSDILNPAISNVLGIKITSTNFSTVSGNFGKVIYNLPIKSIWDGLYTFSVNNNYGTIDGNIGSFTEKDIALRTIGPNLLEVTYLSQVYSGYARYQFDATNTNILSTIAFSGSVLASSIQGVDLVDPVNRKFTIRWTWGGRGVVETWVRTGDR